MVAIRFDEPKEIQGSYGTFSNCRGQGKVTLRFEPVDSGQPVDIKCLLSEEEFPSELRDSAVEGIRQYLQARDVQLDRVQISIVAAVVHPVDRSPLLFRIAAHVAMAEACDGAIGEGQ